MSECGVCIGTEADGTCEFWNVKMVKARKPHKCQECAKTIEPGEKYEYHFSVYEGEPLQMKTCEICAEVRNAFIEPGAAFCPGEVWGEMREIVFPVMTHACLDRLSTPQAKAELQRRWMQWKGLTA